MRDWNECYTRFLNKECSPEEVQALLEHFQLEGEASELRERIALEFTNQTIPDIDTPDVEEMFMRIQQRLEEQIVYPVESPGRVRRFRWLRYAASALVVFSLGWLLFELGGGKSGVPRPVDAADITPGGNRATLMLADGTTVDLSTEQRGIVVADGITYLDGSTVGSESMNMGGSEEQAMLALSTPKGGNYQITLPDGSEVWLNAASTLKYPSRFDNTERVVYLEGEAYFKIREQLVSSGADSRVNRLPAPERIPFRVITNNQTVEVLGTEFNVSAYEDEATVHTTLVHGKVNVMTDSHGVLMLEPGEQATLNGKSFTKKVVDVSSFVAWKSGLFSFDDTPLSTVMSQLGRWYNLDIVYEEGISVTHYYGAISRHEHLDKVLDLLRESGLNVKVERINNTNRLTVLP